MLVVEVCTLVVPSAFSTSAGRPDRSSVIAANDAQVVSAYRRRSPPFAAAVETGMNVSSATAAARNLTLISASQRVDFPPGPYPMVCTHTHVGIDRASH